MILNEVLWIILGIICMLQQPYWFYYLRRRVLLCSVWFSFSFDKVFNQKKKKKKKSLTSVPVVALSPLVQLCSSKSGPVSASTLCVNVP